MRYMTYTILMEKQETIGLVHLLSHKLMWQCIKYRGLGYHNRFNTATFCNQINTPGAVSGAGTAYPSGAAEFTPGFKWCSCYSTFRFLCMFCRSLFVLQYFFFCPLCCLFFFDIRILITPLVSLNSSQKIGSGFPTSYVVVLFYVQWIQMRSNFPFLLILLGLLTITV